MFQEFIVVGNLGNEPELRQTANGTPVTAFKLAINKSWTDTAGHRQDKTVWVRVNCWRKLAETVAQHLHKGSKVLVVGEVEGASVYNGKDGQPAATIEITANVVRFLDTRQAATDSAAAGPELRDEDIPF